MFFNENELKNKIQTYKNKIWHFFDGLGSHGKMKDLDDRKIDVSSAESFPASDSPAHRSKSTEDRTQTHY
jgi:hypothetical protein